ncbi:hypothetical protein V4762_06165 [Thermodesulfobium sp. 4217-1]|uniref:(2Fe-2S) ferredoxin domain-containing protein n=1 Tax=Thermodesulfobium sp. 4217-1 TaxID=3120013 RepID=UPI003221F3A1
MEKIKSIDELRRLKEQSQAFLKTRQKDVKVKIYISVDKEENTNASRDVLLAVLDELKERNFSDFQIIEKAPMGSGIKEPFMALERDDLVVYYSNITPNMAREIIASHAIKGQIVSDWASKRSNL